MSGGTETWAVSSASTGRFARVTGFRNLHRDDSYGRSRSRSAETVVRVDELIADARAGLSARFRPAPCDAFLATTSALGHNGPRLGRLPWGVDGSGQGDASCEECGRTSHGRGRRWLARLTGNGDVIIYCLRDVRHRHCSCALSTRRARHIVPARQLQPAPHPAGHLSVARADRARATHAVAPRVLQKDTGARRCRASPL
jgi:hypothetical protein